MADLVFYRGLYSGQQIDSAVARALSGGALDQEIAALRSAVGSPLVATTAAQMTNTNKIYVYTGSEAGYIAGNWYYFNGSAWTSGGVYNAVAVDMEMSSVSDNPVANRIVTAALADALAEAKAAAYDAYPTESASGAIASTSVGADGIPLKSLTVQIEPVQSGSGDPSPTNVRPISGWMGANIVVSPTQDAQAGTTIPVNWQDEAGTVYAGTLTYIGNKTWRLAGTHNIVDLGTRTWEYDETYFPGYPFFKAFLPNSAAAPAQPSYAGWCSCYPVLVVSTNTGFVSHDKSLVYCKRTLSSGKRVFIRDTDYDGTTIEQFVASISGQTLVYQRETPLIYTLTADDVLSLLGDTNVWADTGDVEAVFRADPTLYIESKIAALTALMSET